MAALSIDQIKQRITALRFMRELDPTAFAEEEGLADSLVQHFKNQRKDLKATQLRKVFQSIKMIQRQIEPEIRKNQAYKNGAFNRATIAGVMVNLAYAKGRNLIPEDFYNIMKQCLSQQKLQNNEDFIRVAEFTEAILAYYKFRGGSS
jgi:CRISPR-associated protein Csm2